MRTTLSLAFFVLTVASTAMAAPDTKPTLAVCKADLKAWSAQKTETLTIQEIDTRMNEMIACADEAHTITTTTVIRKCGHTLTNFTARTLSLRIVRSTSS
jgi:hypothetical protein